jgi:hypothetical protein
MRGIVARFHDYPIDNIKKQIVSYNSLTVYDATNTNLDGGGGRAIFRRDKPSTDGRGWHQ